MEEMMTFTSNTIYRNKSPKVFDCSNSTYASANMVGFKQQKHTDEQLTAWAWQEEVTSNAGGSADLHLLLHYLYRPWI